jgi:hypothetical protein
MRDCVKALWWSRCGCGGMWAVPRLCINLYPDIRLTTEEKSRKTISRGSRKAPNSTVLGAICLVDLVAISRATSTSLLCVTAFGLHPRANWASPPSDMSRVAELRGSAHQPTLSRNCRLGIWCGRRRMELPSPREFAYYWCTNMHQ